MRKRPRLFVAVAAAAALCGAFLAVLVTSSDAQSSSEVKLDLPVGEDKRVSASQIRQGGARRFDGVGTKNGRTLEELVDLSGADETGVSFYALDHTGQPALVERGGNLFFYVERGSIRWLVYDDNNVVQRDDGPSELVTLDGKTGQLIGVRLSISPRRGVKAGDRVRVSARLTNPPPGKPLVWKWFVDGELVSEEPSPIRTPRLRKGGGSVYLDVRTRDGESRGTDADSVTVGSAPRRDSSPGGPGGDGSGGDGSGGDGSGSGSGGGGSGSGFGGGSGGGFGTTPPYDSGTTPALPPPSTSPPIAPGRGPNLDPNAPPTALGPQGERVEGILVSANVPSQSRPGSRGARPNDPQANRSKQEVEGIDWKLVGGIALTSLLLVLGALRERRPIRRLLPQHS